MLTITFGRVEAGAGILLFLLSSKIRLNMGSFSYS